MTHPSFTMRSARRTATLRGIGFLVLCTPLMLGWNGLAVPHPVVLMVALIGATLLALRLDGRPAATLGLDPSLRRVKELGAGLAGGALLAVVMALLIGVVLPFPWARNPRFDGLAAAYSLFWFLCSNATEELVFRGYAFDRLIAGIGHWKAQVVTALVFALFHVANGWSWQVALTGTTIGSLLFGLVFVRWRSVPAAAGVHAAANWTRGLLLDDPPKATTLFAPLSPRPWTPTEQLLATACFTGVTLIACLALAISVRRLERAMPA